MRIANVAGRLKLIVDGGAVDVEKTSRGRFGSDPQAAYDHFDDLKQWGGTVHQADEGFIADSADAPTPAPRQVFAIALNYVDHAKESGMAPPESPLVFTKYVSSFSGPVTEVVLPKGSVDWEVELVAVISKTAHDVAPERAWDYVAGLSVGQDISERVTQRQGAAPQFSLSKSFRGFSPMGPVLVTTDEFDHHDDLEVGCAINGEQMQIGRTSDMLFPIPELVSYISRIVTLYPGDVIFTGTPPGVGIGRTPPRFLQAGDHLHSWIEGIGELDQRFVSGG